MNAKGNLIALIIIVVIGYVIGLTGSPSLFMVHVYISILFLSYVIFSFSVDLILRTLPKSRKTKYEQGRITFKLMIIASYILFLFLVWIINHYFFIDSSTIIGLIGNIGIFLFSVFLGWGLLRGVRRIHILSGTLIFLIFVLMISFLDTTKYEGPETSTIRDLKSLPYLRWIQADNSIEKAGVTVYDEKKSIHGMNLYATRNKPEAFLLDMSGKVLHQWTATIEIGDSWQHIEVCQNGDLLAYVSGKYLMRLDWNSNIRWVKKIRVHHDIDIKENGNIFVLARNDKIIFIHGIPVPVLADYIAVFSSKGKLLKEIPLFKFLKNKISFSRLVNIYMDIFCHELLSSDFFRELISQEPRFVFKHGTAFDIFHNNTVEIIDRDIEGLCKKGDILISVREFNLIGILDLIEEKLVWIWGNNNLSRQHHPTLLKNGNILVFDNGPDRKYSRIIELDPISKKILWKYESQIPERFFSSIRGWCQRLPEENTLITESNKGRVFEITKDHSLVWEFYNPEINEKRNERAAIYSMERIIDPEKCSKLNDFIKYNKEDNDFYLK